MMYGRTKIFIRFPKTLFETEDRFQERKHELVTQITALFRMFRQRKVYRKIQWSGEGAHMMQQSHSNHYSDNYC